MAGPVQALLAAAYRAWYLNRGGADQPSLRAAEQALRHHMPEFVPTFERLVELTGADELAARLLSCYRPPTYLISCSQAALSRPGKRMLVRNYDLDPNLNEGLVMHSAWNGRQVIATSEFMWGVADGMNNAGGPTHQIMRQGKPQQHGFDFLKPLHP